MRRIGSLFLVYLSSYSFGLSFVSAGLHPFILPLLVLEMAPEGLKGTYLSGLTIFGLTLAAIVQPLSGALSDRTAFHWGRRRPYILAGTLALVLLLPFLRLAASFVQLFCLYSALQFAGNIAQGPYQGLIPDLIPRERRGLASGAKALADLMGFVLSAIATSYFMERGRLELALASMVTALILGSFLTLRGVREDQRSFLVPRGRISLRATFQLGISRHQALAWLILSRFFFLVGLSSIQAYGLFFLRDRLGVARPVSAMRNLILVLALAGPVFALPAAGHLSDRVGRRALSLSAGLLGTLGMLLFIAARSQAQILLFGLPVGVGIGTFLVANWAWATDLVPRGEAAKYLGLTNLASAGGAVVARLGGPLIDLFNSRQPGLGYTALLVAITVMLLVGTGLLLKVPETRRSSSPKLVPREQQ